jgi:hypothetical protein
MAGPLGKGWMVDGDDHVFTAATVLGGTSGDTLILIINESADQNIGLVTYP